LPTGRAVSQTLSVMIVVAVILAAFGGYVVGTNSQAALSSQPPSTEIVTLTVTQTVVTIQVVTYHPPSQQTSGKLISLTEYITGYDVEIDTVVLYVQSSTTYTCFEGTAEVAQTSTATVLPVLVNVSGVLTISVATVESNTVNGTTTTTITSSFPLTTQVTTIDNSTVTTTECAVVS